MRFSREFVSGLCDDDGGLTALQEEVQHRGQGD